MTNDELKARVVDLISYIPDEKLEHFAATIEKVANCHQSSTLRAVLMVQDDGDQTLSVFSINSEEEQTKKMICIDPVKNCSGVIFKGNTDEHTDGRRYQTLDGQA